MQRILTCAAAAALMFAGSAMAQTNTPPGSPQVPAEKMDTPRNPSPGAPTTTLPSTTGVAPATTGMTWRASQLIGAAVHNTANENIGDINELLLEQSGKVAQVVIGVGGFLGMGERNIAVNFDQLTLSREKNNTIRISTPYTKDSLKSLPEWKPDNVMSN